MREIERRFLVNGDAWREGAAKTHLVQGYLKADKAASVRVRVAGQEAWLTIKGYISDVERHEFEYPIPLAHAQVLLTMCAFTLEKNRYAVPFQAALFEVDEYLGDNAPLILAEIELDAVDASYPTPGWLGEEVTHDGRFTNAFLSQQPYSLWKEQQ